MASRSVLAGARLAQAHNTHHDKRPVDPVVIEERRRELAEARIADYIEKTLAKFPPLTEEQRVRLAELLKPVRINGNDDRTA